MVKPSRASDDKCGCPLPPPESVNCCSKRNLRDASSQSTMGGCDSGPPKSGALRSEASDEGRLVVAFEDIVNADRFGNGAR